MGNKRETRKNRFTCLSVGEDASVVTLESIFQQILSKGIKDLFLATILAGIVRIRRPETMVKRETLRLLPAI